MSQAAIIADDLTGALDSGVWFLPADVRVLVKAGASQESVKWDAPQVLSLNAQTRHLTPGDAYERVNCIVQSARKAKVPCILKKTDSALRGNVGAELSAAWRASGAPRLHFLPALPRMGRVTHNGVHLVSGVPVAQSEFGNDPFEPVQVSRVDELIALQTDDPVYVVGANDPVPTNVEGIVVYDVTTQQQMLERVRELASLNELGALAGCAGVSEALASVLELPSAGSATVPAKGNLLVVCGSVNAVSQAQCRYAAGPGAAVFHARETQKCQTGWAYTSEGAHWLGEVQASWRQNPLTVIDGSGREDLTGEVPAGTDVRQLVANNLASLAVAACKGQPPGRLLVTGGDVLASFLVEAQVQEVQPVQEIAPGIVTFLVPLSGCHMVVASKSGGFGDEKLFPNLAGLS